MVESFLGPPLPLPLGDVNDQVASVVLQQLPHYKDRHHLAAVNKLFRRAASHVSSLPRVFDFSWDCGGLRSILDDVKFEDVFAYLSRLEGFDGLTRGRVDTLLGQVPFSSADPRVCATAAGSGNLKFLRWAVANEFAWDERTCAFAAYHGHLEILKWARNHGCPWRESTCYLAAKGGHLDVLKWAREHDAAWNAKACELAAQKGNLAVLKWLRANECPWDGETLVSAFRHAKREPVTDDFRISKPSKEQPVLEWLQDEHGGDCPWVLADEFRASWENWGPTPTYPNAAPWYNETQNMYWHRRCAKRFASMGGSILDWQVSLDGGGPRCGMEEIFGTRAMTHEYDVDETTDEENDDDE